MGPIKGQGIKKSGNPGTPGPVFQDPGNPGRVIQDPGNPGKKSGGFNFPENCKKDCIFHITWKEFKIGFLQFTGFLGYARKC